MKRIRKAANMMRITMYLTVTPVCDKCQYCSREEMFGG